VPHELRNSRFESIILTMIADKKRFFTETCHTCAQHMGSNPKLHECKLTMRPRRNQPTRRNMNTFKTEYHQSNNGLEIVLSQPRKPLTQVEIIKRTAKDKEHGNGVTNNLNYGNPSRRRFQDLL
jgi:hypothetical protein